MDAKRVKKDAHQRSRKQGTLVSAYIEQDAYDALQTHCEITGQSKTKAIERAILSYCGATREGHGLQGDGSE